MLTVYTPATLARLLKLIPRKGTREGYQAEYSLVYMDVDDRLHRIPAAYKDIESVIAAQSDLVEVVAHLKQLICVKG